MLLPGKSVEPGAGTRGQRGWCITPLVIWKQGWERLGAPVRTKGSGHR